MDTQVPQFDGVHHLKLPVSDLDRSREWYQSRLGYAVAMEFREDGKVMGLALITRMADRDWPCGWTPAKRRPLPDSITSP